MLKQADEKAAACQNVTYSLILMKNCPFDYTHIFVSLQSIKLNKLLTKSNHNDTMIGTNVSSENSLFIQ